ncbi:MAG: preprotein translocase subunit SecA [Candidatus Uhrbacteria bacterium]
MLKFLFGDPNARVVRKLQPIIDRVNALEREFEGLDALGLRETTVRLRQRLDKKETLDDILPEAFAAVRESARRTLGQRHYDEQLVGGIVLHGGQIAEMRTGEGKTLTATLAVYLNALTGKGVHVVTVNDYLARRDSAWMGQIYHALGLTIGCLNHETAYRYDVGARREAEGVSGDAADAERDATGAFRVAYDFLRPIPRQEAYLCDITYGTNNEFGFDYLRDNMVYRFEDAVQRGYAYAIVDEVDSILIDEARTPLIISAPAEESGEEYVHFAQLVRALKRDSDFTIDEKLRAVTLTEEGIARVESLLGVENVYAQGTKLVHHLEQALRAQTLYQRDRHYVVRPSSSSGEPEVVIVDEFTGRLMPGRRYSEGLHQAIEAKEGVPIQRESQTLATITFQNYFRLYSKLAGMTGTAATEAEEFSKIYNLEVVTIPTHRPMIRRDSSDRIYRTEQAKLDAVVKEVAARHAQGQPILLGTISIEKNEQLHELLDRSGIPHTVLNAKQHEREGEVIAQAGRPGAVTLATNMAGRGVDIILGGNPSEPAAQEAVRAANGLYVIGTERHESRRIDNQLRGRSGRQGDPGSSRFFVSLEDDLMRIFGGARLQGIMTRLGVPDDMPIENRVVSKQIEAAQRKVEHHHFDTRKHLLEYDDVLSKHREVIYRKRYALLTADDPLPVVESMIDEECERLIAALAPGDRPADWDIEALTREVGAVIPIDDAARARLPKIDAEQTGKLSAAEAHSHLCDWLGGVARAHLVALRERIGDDIAHCRLIRSAALRAIDQLWIEHLDAVEHLRQGIGLRGYGQRDPLIEYKHEAYKLFTELLAFIQQDIARALCHAVPTMEAQSVFAQRQLQFAGATKTMERGHRMIMAGGESEDERRVVPPERYEGATTVEPPAKARDSQGQKVGRNDPCPCGAAKADGRPVKYKKCHGK